MRNHTGEAFEFVSSRGWLAEQPPSFRSRLLSEAAVREYDAGAFLHQSGAPLTSLMGLAEGAVEIFWDHPLLGRRLIHIAQPGIWLGEPLAYGAQTRVVTARCKTRSRLVVVPRRGIEALTREDPLCIKFFGLLSDLHIRECLTGLVEALHEDALSRVCARITTLGLAHARDRDDTEISLPLNQDEMAKLCGMSRKSLGRIIARLKRAQIVDIHYGVVTVLDRKRLGEIAAEGGSAIQPSESGRLPLARG